MSEMQQRSLAITIHKVGPIGAYLTLVLYTCNGMHCRKPTISSFTNLSTISQKRNNLIQDRRW